MIKSYLKIATRNLRANKTYTILNIAGLTLGVSCAILIFIFLQYHLSFDQHQPDENRLYRVVLDLHLEENTEHEPGSSVPLGAALTRDFPQIEKAGFIGKMPDVTISAESGKDTKRFIEKSNTAYADYNYINMFALDWLTDFDISSMKEPSTVVISEKIALKYFGKKEVSGKILRLNNAVNLKIAGVFTSQDRPTDLDFEILISLPTLKIIDPEYDQQQFGWISSRNYTFVKLASGSDHKLLEKLVLRNGAKYYGADSKYYQHKFQPLSEIHFDEKYDGKISKSILWILGGVGVFLLSIACINFINLATAQALKRAKEIGVRKVLGGTQQQLFWQFMSETALIAFSSSILSVILVAALMPFMNNLTQTRAYHLSVLFQTQFLLFWFISLSVTVLIAGFYPSVIISGFSPVSALKGKIGNSQVGGLGLRRSLVTVQLAIAQILIIGSLVLYLQLKFFRNADIGFDQQAVVTLSLPKQDATHKITQSLKQELLQYSDIVSVSYQFEAPTSTMGYGGSVRFDNRLEWEKFVIRDRFGDENYLDTYKMKLMAGRSFMDKDSVTEFVINEELMRRLGIHDPQKILGKTLEDGNSGFKGPIVGVVKSFHLKSLQEAIEPCAIFANPKLYKEVAIKMDTKNLSRTLENIQKAWSEIYPNEVFENQFVDEKIAKFYEKEELLTTLIEAFAGIAILICALGLYGMVSFMVSQRTKEIGIRKVLGASVDSIVTLFGKEFIALVALAFILSAPVAWYAVTKWLNNFAYRIDLDWWILASGGIIILAITLMTVCYKVITAAMTNPVNSLKNE
ncbi:ABC transporter permease [Dyadobacter sp. CY345]|uniref:FtsX-like permease family protein n=1 Tax=Dyadobacter sp. CY345 TaxID=2909335 RepID=UPI001F170A85|nr:FtsX-like permease family protein [Dyadobacter sp. CY345]MCF2446902.1 ABC transporter permease [Dyadobacter sp. CY345]